MDGTDDIEDDSECKKDCHLYELNYFSIHPVKKHVQIKLVNTQ